MTKPQSVVREATPADVPEIIAYVKDLAVYEKEPVENVKLTEQKLTELLFCEHPRIYAHVVESDSPDHGIDGFAIWLLNFSTWEGTHGIWLEDLYVRPEVRKHGKGKALLQKLASIAHERGYKRMEWSVLKWNTPAMEFYSAIGAYPMVEWDTHRLTGEALTTFATSDVDVAPEVQPDMNEQ